jgi:hypothetical protein
MNSGSSGVFYLSLWVWKEGKTLSGEIGYLVEGLSEGHLANKLFEDEGPDETLTIV